MCVVCTDWLKGKMTSEEALRALGELISADDNDEGKKRHYFDTVDKIMEDEVPFNENRGKD